MKTYDAVRLTVRRNAFTVVALMKYVCPSANACVSSSSPVGRRQDVVAESLWGRQRIARREIPAENRMLVAPLIVDFADRLNARPACSQFRK